MSEDPTAITKTLSTTITTSLLVGIVSAIVIVAVIAVGVRRQRPDAYLPLLVWGICLVATDVVLGFGGAAYIESAGRQGVEAIIRAQIHSVVVNMIVTLVLNGLLMFGILRLARPPKPIVPQGDPPYR